MNNVKAVVLGLLAVLLWAVIPSLVKLGTVSHNIPLFILLRFTISSLVFLPLFPSLMRRVGLVHAKYWLAMLIVLPANYYFQTIAMQGLPASWYVVIFSLNPILAISFMGIRLTRNNILCLVGAVFGTLLFVQSDDLSKLVNPLVLGSLLIGMLTWVLYTVIVSQFQKQFNDVECTALTSFTAWTGAFIVWAGFGFPMSPLSGLDGANLLVLGLTTPIAYYGFSYCIRRLPLFGIASQYLEPVFGVVSGIVLFHEVVSIHQWVATALIVTSVSRLSK